MPILSHFLKHPMKMKEFGLTETKFHFHRIFKNGGGGGGGGGREGGSNEPPEPLLNSPTVSGCTSLNF